MNPKGIDQYARPRSGMSKSSRQLLHLVERITLIPSDWHLAMDEITLAQFWASPAVLIVHDCPSPPEGMVTPLPY